MTNAWTSWVSVLTLLPLLFNVQAFPTSQIPLRTEHQPQGPKFEPLLHLPGISRYFDAAGFGLQNTPPDGCKVTAASYLVRHSAIYANDNEYEEYIKPFLNKLEEHRGKFSGPLEFLNKWQSPIDEDKLEDITPHGIKDAERVGETIRRRYSHLVGTAMKVLSDKKSRCMDTARAFIKSFPNSDSIEVVRFKKPKDRSMNPIIPHKSCPSFDKSPGKQDMWTFIHTYAAHTSARLHEYTPWELSDADIVAMQSICGYESAITGEASPICPIFSDSEWMSYEYAWDLRYAHMVGPLNPMSNYLGFPWLQAQSHIFQRIDMADHANTTFDANGLIVDPESSVHEENDSSPGAWSPAQRFFVSFTHREVPPLIASALGIFNSSFEDEHQFPTDRVVWTRAWRMADLIPFLGHVGLEKMSCDRPGHSGDFVRVIANTAPRPIPRCQDGPGASCSLEDFVQIVGEGASEFAHWRPKCGLA